MTIGNKCLRFAVVASLLFAVGAEGSEIVSRREAARAGSTAAPHSSATVPAVVTNYLWNNAWVVDSRSTATFDGQGRAMSILTESWSGSGWESEGLIEYTYSSANWPDTQTVYIWNTFFSAWDQINRTAYQYDGLGNVLVQTMQEHTSQVWQNFTRTTWTRDGLGKPIEQTNEIWSSGVWNNSTRTVFNFSGDQLMDAENYFWIGSWSLLGRSLYSYGPDGETEELQQSWNGSFWTDTQLYTTTYSSGLPSVYLYQVWTGTMWVDQNRQLYQSYDGQGRLEAEDTQFYVGLWQNTSRTEYDYGTPTGIGDEMPSTLPNGVALQQNYPNPFNPSTEIAFTLPMKSAVRVQVIDILGRTVAEPFDGDLPAGDHVVTWDGRSTAGDRAASGVYFYRLSTESGSLARKMLLVK